MNESEEPTSSSEPSPEVHAWISDGTAGRVHKPRTNRPELRIIELPKGLGIEIIVGTVFIMVVMTIAAVFTGAPPWACALILFGAIAGPWLEVQFIHYCCTIINAIVEQRHQQALIDSGWAGYDEQELSWLERSFE